MSKYIIELKPEYEDSFKGVVFLGTKDSNLYIDTLAVEDLEELNSDYINEHFGELQDEVYQQGLNDAWEAAQKVVCKTEMGGMTLDTLQEVFGVLSPAAIMQSNTAQEVIDKIKAYEQKQTKRDIGNDIDYLMQSTGMTVEEIAQELKKMRN